MADSKLSGGTIRSRLLLVVLAALIPIVFLGAWQSSMGYRNARLLVADGMRAKARAIAESERDPFIIASHVLNFARQQPTVLNMTPQCNEVLRTALQGANGVVNFLRTDSQGKARCSVLPFTPGTDLSRDKWWLEALGKPGLVVSSPQVGRISQVPVLILARSLQTPGGEFAGTLSAGISLEQLALELQRKQAAETDAIVVVNRLGDPVLQSPGNRFRTLPNIDQAQNEPLEILADDGTEWTYVSAPLFGNQLFVVYAKPTRSLMASLLAASRIGLALQLLALVTTSLAIWIAAQRLILNWLAKLQHLTARFAKGDFSLERRAYASAPAEIALLADQMHDMAEAIDSYERGLRAALAAEGALTREVHHRVNNNLQIVTSLLSLQHEKSSDPWVREVIGAARTRIGALSLIHRLLYQEGVGGEQGAVNLRQLLSALCGQLRAANRERSEIALECVSADTMMAVEQVVPLTLFAVEAVTNAFRHGFGPGQAGTIKVAFATEAGHARLSVYDDGKGLRKAGATPGMGFDLMESFSAQLGGTMEVAGSETGTVVTLRFPWAGQEA